MTGEVPNGDGFEDEGSSPWPTSGPLPPPDAESVAPDVAGSRGADEMEVELLRGPDAFKGSEGGVARDWVQMRQAFRENDPSADRDLQAFLEGTESIIERMYDAESEEASREALTDLVRLHHDAILRAIFRISTSRTSGPEEDPPNDDVNGGPPTPRRPRRSVGAESSGPYHQN